MLKRLTGDQNALLRAVTNGDIVTVKELLEKHVDPNFSADNGAPLLCAAISSKRRDNPKILEAYSHQPSSRIGHVPPIPPRQEVYDNKNAYRKRSAINP